MNEYIYLGCVPYEEPCAQIGQDDFDNRSKLECRIYKEQLWRVIKDKFNLEPNIKDFDLVVKNEYHDFGTYREVCAKFNYNNDNAVKLAYDLEDITPANWDDMALEQLKQKDYYI